MVSEPSDPSPVEIVAGKRKCSEEKSEPWPTKGPEVHPWWLGLPSPPPPPVWNSGVVHHRQRLQELRHRDRKALCMKAQDCSVQRSLSSDKRKKLGNVLEPTHSSLDLGKIFGSKIFIFGDNSWIKEGTKLFVEKMRESQQMCREVIAVEETKNGKVQNNTIIQSCSSFSFSDSCSDCPILCGSIFLHLKQPVSESDLCPSSLIDSKTPMVPTILPTSATYGKIDYFNFPCLIPYEELQCKETKKMDSSLFCHSLVSFWHRSSIVRPTAVIETEDAHKLFEQLLVRNKAVEMYDHSLAVQLGVHLFILSLACSDCKGFTSFNPFIFTVKEREVSDSSIAHKMQLLLYIQSKANEIRGQNLSPKGRYRDDYDHDLQWNEKNVFCINCAVRLCRQCKKAHSRKCQFTNIPIWMFASIPSFRSILIAHNSCNRTSISTRPKLNVTFFLKLDTACYFLLALQLKHLVAMDHWLITNQEEDTNLDQVICSFLLMLPSILITTITMKVSLISWCLLNCMIYLKLSFPSWFGCLPPPPTCRGVIEI